MQGHLMEIETITTIISTVGFPIFVCLVLFWFIKNYLDKFITTLGEFSSTLEKNSNSLERLSDKLEKIKNV